MLCVPRMSPRISLKNERRGVTGRIDGVQVSKSDNMSTLQAKRPTTSLSVTRALSVPLSVRDIEPALLLVDADLWAKFHSHQNEMILTKSGRCLFPCLNFKAVNLDSKAIYTIHLDFETMDSHRFRFSSGRWSPAQPSERSGNDDFANSKSTVRSVLSQGLYMHPDLRQTGKHWMEKNMISFANVKLTNRVPEPDTQRLNGRSRENDYIQTGNHIFHLVSFHKYRPRIHLTQCSQQTRESTFSTTFTYDQTSFIAVTHYQNHRVNDLKKDHNPHAKGFRDTIGYSPSQSTKRRRMISSSSSTRSTESSLGTWSRLDKEENASDGEGQASEEFESDSMGNEGDSKRKFVHLCRQNKDDSAMVTISMARDTAQVTGHLKSSPGLIGHNQITMTTATMDTTQHKGVGSTRGNVPLFLTPEYGSIAKTRESKVVRTRGYNLGDISTSNELDRLQDVFVGTSSPLSTPQPRAARVHIDTAPASLFQVTNPMLPIPSNTNTSTDTAVELPNLSALALLNQATAECAALAEANSSAAIMPTHEAVIFDTAPSMS
ncbi:hypothetical protein BC939DRAFT_497794, partial [Gamsiella multidivaricata]|uniref:uncharacterized protein n=1 Tax=Gamsiella multidivaricata TaxID=101098 RepID=UPI00221F11BF